MKNITTHAGELKLIERMKNSTLGNPQFMLTCDGYKFRTPANSMLGYEAENYIGKNVRVNIGTHYGCLTLHSIST